MGRDRTEVYRKFFLYRHVSLKSNMPFYIGIGLTKPNKHQRFFNRAYSKSGRTEQWKAEASSGYEVDILYQTDSELEIEQKESEFVSLYGRTIDGTGCLVNVTSGGKGGCEFPKEYTRSISKRMKGNKNGANQVFSEERRRAISARMKGRRSWCAGKKMPKSFGDKISLALRGRVLDQDRRNSLRGCHPNAKPILCETTGIQYESIGECIRLMFGCNLLAKDNRYRAFKHGISNAANGKIPNYKNHKFRFL